METIKIKNYLATLYLINATIWTVVTIVVFFDGDVSFILKFGLLAMWMSFGLNTFIWAKNSKDSYMEFNSFGIKFINNKGENLIKFSEILDIKRTFGFTNFQTSKNIKIIILVCIMLYFLVIILNSKSLNDRLEILYILFAMIFMLFIFPAILLRIINKSRIDIFYDSLIIYSKSGEILEIIILNKAQYQKIRRFFMKYTHKNLNKIKKELII
ncbi:hypothetical protein [Campylobacter ureolyticus]|uniref:hypothetical protein n=1 Tax=Campylobacter ureolyticus TaxID=827 RepID=UPI0022B4A06C|nr:hypothetical protein [Campylobacter ureolyticus]MCZ6116640.1 hypothetical protein [Campylobacter ureolyticus]MDK8322849.1 hypothetical protein [Campylobacter ureolyticus]